MQTDASSSSGTPPKYAVAFTRFNDEPLSALAARRRFSVRAAAIGRIVFWLAIGTIIAMAVDVQWVLSAGIRFGIAMVLLAVGAALFVRYFLAEARRIDTRFMTREVEAGVPQLGQLLTTARDPALKGPNVSPLLRQELMARASKALKAVDDRPFLDRKRTQAILALGIVSVVLWLSYLGMTREGSLALNRLFHPFSGPTFTTVHITTSDPTFTGQRLPKVEAMLTGRLISPVTVEYPGPDGKPVKIQMTRVSSDHFEATLPPSEQSFEYRIQAGDSRFAVATMENADPAKWVSSSAEIAMPDYIGRPVIKQDNADIDTVEDSQVTVRMQMSLPMREGSFELPDGRKVPMTVKGAEMSATFPAIPSEKVASFKGIDSHGHVIEPVQFKYVVHRDELPKIEWVEPSKDTEATSVAEIPLRLRVRDDYGVASIGVVLSARGEDKTLLTKEFEAKDLTDVSQLAVAALEEFPLTIRDNVRIYAWAKDRKPRDGARANSELRGVDILPFKRKWMKLHGGGGPGGPPPPAAKELAKIEDLIKEQRRILSDGFQMPIDAKEARDASVSLSGRELKLQDKSAEVADAAKDDPTWPRDDLSLLNAAVDQMGESSLGWGEKSDPKLGFDRGDAALSDLLELRKNLLTMLMDSKSEDEGKPAEEGETPDPLSKLAEEAERLAKEERDVSEQVKKDAEGKNLDAPKRQQDIAKSDAGELYANLMKHPDATPLVRSKMGDAEQEMGKASGELNSPHPATAPPELDNAAERLDDVARHLRELDAGKLDETLAAMSAEAKEAAQEAEKAAGDQQGDKKGDEGKKDGADGKDAAEAKNGDKGEGKGDDGKGKGEGQDTAKADGEGKGKGDGKGEGKDGQSTAQAQGEGKGQGKGKGKGGKGQGEGSEGEGEGGNGEGSPSSKRSEQLVEAAKQAATNDDILKSLAAKEESTDGDSRLEALRKEANTEALEEKLKALAEGKGDPDATAKQLAGLAQALEQERAFRQQSRLEGLTKAKEQVEKAKKEAEAGANAIAKAAEEAQDANDGAFSFSPSPEVMEKARQAAGKGNKGGKDQKGGGAPGEGGNPYAHGGGGESDLARALNSFHDPELHRVAGALRDATDKRPDPVVLSAAERRLAELIEQIAGIGRADNSTVAAPPASRRAVEDYFRALSDDLGDDAVDQH